MNSGIENYRRTNLNIQSNLTNPADIYRNFNSQIIGSNGSNQPQQQQIHQVQPQQQSHPDQNFLLVPNPQVQQLQFQHPMHAHQFTQMSQISPFVPASNHPINSLSQIDLLEKDINNIFSNNITPDRLERLGSGIVANGQVYDIGSLNPKHQMLGEYEKPTNLIHNNISKNVYAETLQEYTIVVDSTDRDIAKYPNPFSYRVKFNGLPGTSDANVMRSFDYVKYIKLDTGIIPAKYYYVKQDTSLNSSDFNTVKTLNLTSNPPNSTFILASPDVSGSFAIIDITDVSGSTVKTRYIRFAIQTEYPTQVDTVYEFIFDFTENPFTPTYTANNYIARYKLQPYSLVYDKYTLLYIDELNSPNENSTNDAVGKSFSVMFPDGANGDILYTSSGFIDKMYRFALLGQLNQMTISIANSNGTVLKNSQENYIDKNIKPIKTCTCTTDTNGYFVRNYGCVCTYFRHPYYQKFQNTLVFRIGVIEPNIDKNIFS